MKEPEAKARAAPVDPDWSSPDHVRSLMLMAVTVIGLYLCYRLTLPFLSALAWALALGVVFLPFQRWLERKVKQRTVAALISVTLIGGVVLGLVFFVGQRLVVEATAGAELIRSRVESGEWRQELSVFPRLEPVADWLERQDLIGVTTAVATWMTTTGSRFITGSLIEVIALVMTFYFLFFVLRDHQGAMQLLRSLPPLTPAEMERMFRKVGDTVYATVCGTLAVSAVQGLLGGLMFWILGLPAPLLWGVIMALLAIVPVLGPFVIWIPAALYLVIQGSMWKALILVVWGVLVVGTSDNLLRPVFVGQRLKIHTLSVFVSVVGGVIAFGASGIVLGPVILSITTELLEVWHRRAAAGS
jgi:predicted PurR-regulated permease PerM